MMQDAHSHIQDCGAATAVELLREASSTGIKRIFCDATSPLSFQLLKDLASDRVIVPFFGLHPWHADSAPAGWLESLSEIMTTFSFCAIGEIGLDKGKRGPDIFLQEDIFRKQLELAIQIRRPVTIHCVKAWKELLDILKSYGRELPPFLLHAFSGKPEELAELAVLGAFVSFSPQALFSGNPEVKMTLHAVPTDRLLLETDFPYRFNGEVNGPAYAGLLSRVYGKAAEILRVEREELEERIWNNGSLFTHGITAR